ncbi:FecR family protein [Paraburkholderia sp.]|uniref:FecR family protein n=1 Tax=Paraburkholderia sp. TaxID=1926495 RepID=UPI003D6F4585
MRLGPPDKNQIDDLFVSRKHDDMQQQAQACATLRKLGRASAANRDYIEEQEAAEAIIDSGVAALRRRYPRPVVSSLPTAPARTNRRWGGWVSGAFALSVAAAFWIANPELSQQDGESAVGQQMTLTLDDGSRVLLNTGSAIHFANRLRSREVVLEQGEALFSVAHNALRPFHVQAGFAHIRDIGTQFSVRLRDTGVDVAVLEGRVAITLPKQTEPVLLTANEAIHTDGLQRVQRRDPGMLTEWKDHRLDFDRTPLAEVVRELQRYRTAPIVLTDARVGWALISGGGSNADPDRLLKTLPEIAPVTVAFKTDGTAVIAPR